MLTWPIIYYFFPPTVDITVYHNGYHGDLNETFFVGEVDEGAKKLVQTTYECLMQAIDSGKDETTCKQALNNSTGHMLCEFDILFRLGDVGCLSDVMYTNDLQRAHLHSRMSVL